MGKKGTRWRHRASIEERLAKWSIEEPNSGCHLWLGFRDKDGYGIVHHRDHPEWNGRAHRVAYAVYRGPIPPGAIVCHRCDQPACVNPAHLFLGSTTDNVHDKIAKGRTRLRFGEEFISAARYARRRGLLQREISGLLGLSLPYVWHVTSGPRRRRRHGPVVVHDDPQLIALVDGYVASKAHHG